MSLDGILAIAVGLVIAALAVFGYVEHAALDKARANLGAYSQQVKQDDAALATAGASLADALKVAQQWRETCTIGQAGLDSAKAEIASLVGQLSQSQAALRAAEEKDRATPACSALLNADLDAACPDVTGRLRLRPAAPGGGH